MRTVSFSVEGYPVPKGSYSHVGKGRFIPQGNPDRINAWRGDVRYAAREAMGDQQPWTGAIRLSLDLSLPYPHSIIRKYQFGWLPHIKSPDVDKLLRSVCDHLTGIVYVDDAQVCFVALNKGYAWDDTPGAFIEATEMDEPWLKQYAQTRAMIKETIKAMEGADE